MGSNNFVKRTVQILISVSACSLFLCCYCYSTGFSLFPHSFNVYFSSLLFSIFTHTLERKYMFLICNGILAFLAKYSSISHSSADCDGVDVDVDVNVNDGAYSAELSPMKEEVFEDEKTSTFEEEEEEKKECLLVEEKESQVLEPNYDVEDDDGGEEEEIESGGGGEDLYSTEELNKKIEEFIRKMKEEIRIEAQQQLITVE